MALSGSDQAIVDQIRKLSSSDVTYTDDELISLYHANDDSVSVTVASLWEETMSSTSTLMDISEGPSRRNLSDVHDNAVKLAAYWRAKADAETGGGSNVAHARAIVRPS